jgi:predicted  nucleic acid-binding Zn-ribbon protein
MTSTTLLLTLQETDTAIDRLTARRDALRSGGALAAIRDEADAGERAFGELRLQLDVMARDQMRFEHEIDSMTQKVVAEERRLFDGSIANAKELGSIQHEVENLKRRRTDREDELLALLEQREVLEARIADAEAAAGALRTRVEETIGTAADELHEVDTELAARVADRAGLASQLDPELVELYDDLRRTKKGIGAAALVDGVCQGCHEQLSSVEVDRLKRTDGIKRCEHCRRILVS